MRRRWRRRRARDEEQRARDAVHQVAAVLALTPRGASSRKQTLPQRKQRHDDRDADRRSARGGESTVRPREGGLDVA